MRVRFSAHIEYSCEHRKTLFNGEELENKSKDEEKWLIIFKVLKTFLTPSGKGIKSEEMLEADTVSLTVAVSALANYKMRLC